MVADLGGPDQGVVVHRASLLRELLAPLPKEVLHPSKNLVSINPQSDGSIELKFEDGTGQIFDAVIGADGIFSSVRGYVLGDVAQEHVATPAGFWDCRRLVSMEQAKRVLGEELFEVDRQYGWVGDNAFIMHDVLENRTMVQIVVSAVEKEHPKDRKRPLTRELLTETLKNWPDGPFRNGIIDVGTLVTF